MVKVYAEGVDYSWARPQPSALFKAGKRFACRYIAGTGGKNLSKAEAAALAKAGVAVVSNWENAAGDARYGEAKGHAAGVAAKRNHAACGGPADRPIYFSIDFDASTAQLPTCYSYLLGAAKALGTDKKPNWDRVGVYGSYRVVEYMHSKGVKWLWQTYAWSGGKLSSHAHIHQYHNGVKVAGADTDLDAALQQDYGQWGTAGSPTSSEDDLPTVKEVWHTDNTVMTANMEYDADYVKDNPGWTAATALEVANRHARIGRQTTEAMFAELKTMHAEMKAANDADAKRDADLLALVDKYKSGGATADEVMAQIADKLSSK
jgi:hypothetical protein